MHSTKEFAGNIQVFKEVRCIRHKLGREFSLLARLLICAIRRVNIVEQGLDGDAQRDIGVCLKRES
jgi:hypothetical protein